MVEYVTKHASNLITKSVEAQQQEEDEQCEVEEVSDQGFDETYRNYCATDVF